MHILRKTTLISLVLSVCLLGGVVPLRADQRSDCEKRVRKAEQRLNDEVRKHGDHSSGAEQRRRELEQERARCRDTGGHGHDHDHDHH